MRTEPSRRDRPFARGTLALVLVAVAVLSTSRPAAAQSDVSPINPHPRAVLSTSIHARWNFDSGGQGWHAVHDCTLEARGGELVVLPEGSDPYFHGPAISTALPITLRLTVSARGAGDGQVFWTTAESPHWDEAKSAHFAILHDGERREIAVELPGRGTATRLRIDPGSGPGATRFDEIAMEARELHPIEIESVEIEGGHFRVAVRNHADQATHCTLFEESRFSVPGGGRTTVEFDGVFIEPIHAVELEIRPDGLPPVKRTIYVFNDTPEAEWIAIERGPLRLDLAPDGSGARIARDGTLVARICPLVQQGGRMPAFEGRFNEQSAEFVAQGVHAKIELVGPPDDPRIDLAFEADPASGELEGPALRAVGPLEQAVFPGIEYLGKGERSSSTLDLETPDAIRFAPDPMKVTAPFMICRTDRATVTLSWRDTALQPVFATPNFFDGTPDHRMALRGSRIEATIRVTRGSLEEAILRAALEHGLPDRPEPPRAPGEIAPFALGAFDGPLAGPGGWGHCAEANWPREPYADVASILWRITGRAPALDRIVPGGSHIPDEAIWFASSRVAEWLDRSQHAIEGLLDEQRADGSFRYSGPYARGHFEDTASGYVASRAVRLLEFARLTGDARALEGGVLALDFMKRFRTPRGAQTWEIPLHTPDILASAYLVWAYTRGFELTGNEEYRREAVRWAASGIPFVYLWGSKPVMAYATIPVYGATNWKAPVWIGLPVQWCGVVYAYALTLVSNHDASFAWPDLARGILLAAEGMQYPSGPLAGCLPDVFDLPSQSRLGPSINPCGILTLRFALQGEPHCLFVSTSDGHRVASPYPVMNGAGVAVIAGPAGARFHVLADGTRVVDVEIGESGETRVPLE